MLTNVNLFDAEQVQDFIVQGYAMVQPQLPAGFHHAVCRQIERDGSPGDHVLERLPDIHEVLNDPRVAGVLASILGPRYCMERPRYAHSSAPGVKRDGEFWHQDYPLQGRFRYHRPRYLNVFYYPQEVTDTTGPTAVLPGSQYYMTKPDDITEVRLCCEAGTVVVMHADLWHQGKPDHGDRMRHMMRFIFGRREDPQEPSWRTGNATWQLARASRRNCSVMRDIWRWYHGRQRADVELTPCVGRSDVPSLLRALADESTAVRRAAADDLAFAPTDTGELVPALAGALQDEDEAVRLNAGYALSNLDEAALSAMTRALRGEARATWRHNLCRQVTLDGRGNADFTNPSQLLMPQALAAMGELAIPELIGALRQDDEASRSAAAITLACMGRVGENATPALIEALRDESEWVRRNATEALENMGAVTGPTASAVAAAWRCLEADIIRACVRWYLCDSLTYETLEGQIRERGLIVKKVDIVRWVEEHASTLDVACPPRRRQRNSFPWRIDEHYGKICGRDTYVYRAIDAEQQTVDFFLTDMRGSMRAKAFLQNALGCPSGG